MVPKEHRHSRSELGITRASGYAASCKINVQAQRKQHISIKTRRLLCKRTNIKRRVLSLRQGPRPGKDKRRSTNKVSLIKSKHTPSSAGRMPEDARIVLPHFLEHGKRQAVSQHKVKSGLQEVATCRRSQSSDNTNPALSRHGSKLLPCSTTLHSLMEPLPQQYKTHKRPVAAAEVVRPSARALPKSFFFNQAAASPHSDSAHAGPCGKEDHAEMWIQIKD